MQKQRAERRKTEMKEKAEKKTREAKIEQEMNKLKKRQNKMKKENTKGKKVKEKAVDEFDTNAGFDPLAKAIEIINELDQKVANQSSTKSDQSERHILHPSAAVTSEIPKLPQKEFENSFPVSPLSVPLPPSPVPVPSQNQKDAVFYRTDPLLYPKFWEYVNFPGKVILTL